MIAVAACIAISLVIVLIFRLRPAVWISIGILALLFLPRVATRSWLASAGNLADVHPAIWLFLTGFVITMMFSPLKEGVPTGRRWLIRALAVWGVLVLLVAVQQSGTRTALLVSLLYLAPLAAFFAINSATLRLEPRLWSKLAPVVLFAAGLEAVLGILQWVTHTPIVFGEYFATNSWWSSYLERAVGTLDSPLDLAAVLSMAIPLTACLKRTSSAFVVSILLALGVLVTGSRTGILLAAIAIVWVLLTRSANIIVGAIVSTLLALATLTFLVSPLSDQLLDRFGARGDASTQARSDSLSVGLGLISGSPVTGHGVGFSYTYSTSQLQTSFENGYLSTAIDLGLPITIVLLGLQIWAVFSTRGSRLIYRLPGAFAIVWGFSYSSLLSSSNFGTISWVFIALASISGIAMTHINKGEGDPEPPPFQRKGGSSSSFAGSSFGAG